MHVPQVTRKEAEAIFDKSLIEVVCWTTMTIRNERYDGVICDYTDIQGYTVAYACEVWDCIDQKRVQRFNIMRKDVSEAV